MSRLYSVWDSNCCENIFRWFVIRAQEESNNAFFEWVSKSLIWIASRSVADDGNSSQSIFNIWGNLLMSCLVQWEATQSRNSSIAITGFGDCFSFSRISSFVCWEDSFVLPPLFFRCFLSVFWIWTLSYFRSASLIPKASIPGKHSAINSSGLESIRKG